MRSQTSTAAVVESDVSANEFGTGLRARLEVAREEAVERERAEQPVRRDVSPELMLVSPETEADLPWNGLAELLMDGLEARRAPLGALLAEAGLLEAAEIDLAVRRAHESGKRLGEVLVEHGLVTPAEVVRLVAAQRGLPFHDLKGISVDPAAAKLLPVDLAHDFLTLPVGFVRGLPVVAVADPTDEGAMHGARSILRCVRFLASPEDAILDQLGQVYLRPKPSLALAL